MTATVELEQGYRRWLRCYPRAFRRDHETEILGVLLAGARDGQQRPGRVECFDLLRSALSMRLRPTVSRSHRSVFQAVRLMYLGALVELAVAITVFATIGDVRTNVAAANPGLTPAQWHAAVAAKLDPLVAAAGIAVAFWLWMAWANGRGHCWARIAFVMFFAMNTYSLLQGLAQGSAVYARADLAIGTVLWVVELAVVALLFHEQLRKIAESRTNALGLSRWR